MSKHRGMRHPGFSGRHQSPSQTAAAQHFAQVPTADIQRSRFDRSHAYKTTFNEGLLIPVFVDEVLPGDTFNLKSTAFARMSTPLYPVMDNLYLDLQFFFVPYRLVWDNWQNFMGERPTPDFDPTTLSMPQFQFSLPKPGTDTSTLGTLWDYFGLPLTLSAGAAAANVSVSALPFRAYNLIWNEWYRDENLQNPLVVNKGDGPDTDVTLLNVAPRGKRKDYFTSALPWPQKGDSVMIPMGTSAPIKGIGTFSNSTVISNPQVMNETDGSHPTYQYPLSSVDVSPHSFGINTNGATPPLPDVYADLTQATAVTINALREAFQIQKLLERDARGGTRYIELILSHFGVRSPDARLQRPEFLGGGSTRVGIFPVPSTVAQTGGAPQANLAAFGTALGDAKFSHSFVEHGIVIGLASVRSDYTYQQGIERFWSRQTRYDHYWPALSHLGEQGILNKEIFVQGTAVDDDVFGYQERYAEYRYKPSRVTNLFSSLATDSLDVWHLAQDFATLPTLSPTFIQEAPPVARVVAVPSQPHFLLDVWHDLKCDRPMPIYSVPGFVDHF